MILIMNRLLLLQLAGILLLPAAFTADDQYLLAERRASDYLEKEVYGSPLIELKKSEIEKLTVPEEWRTTSDETSSAFENEDSSQRQHEAMSLQELLRQWGIDTSIHSQRGDIEVTEIPRDNSGRGDVPAAFVSHYENHQLSKRQIPPRELPWKSKDDNIWGYRENDGYQGDQASERDDGRNRDSDKERRKFMNSGGGNGGGAGGHYRMHHHVSDNHRNNEDRLKGAEENQEEKEKVEQRRRQWEQEQIMRRKQQIHEEEEEMKRRPNKPELTRLESPRKQDQEEGDGHDSSNENNNNNNNYSDKRKPIVSIATKPEEHMTYEERLRQWQRMKEEYDKLVREKQTGNYRNRTKTPEELENERKLQDYIRRNTPIDVSIGRHGHNRTQTSPLSKPDERRFNQRPDDRRKTEDTENRRHQTPIPLAPQTNEYEEELRRREEEHRRRQQHHHHHQQQQQHEEENRKRLQYQREEEERRHREREEEESLSRERPPLQTRPTTNYDKSEEGKGDEEEEQQRLRENEAIRQAEHRRRLEQEHRRRLIEEQSRLFEEEQRKQRNEQQIRPDKIAMEQEGVKKKSFHSAVIDNMAGYRYDTLSPEAERLEPVSDRNQNQSSRNRSWWNEKPSTPVSVTTVRPEKDNDNDKNSSDNGNDDEDSKKKNWPSVRKGHEREQDAGYPDRRQPGQKGWQEEENRRRYFELKKHSDTISRYDRPSLILTTPNMPTTVATTTTSTATPRRNEVRDEDNDDEGEHLRRLESTPVAATIKAQQSLINNDDTLIKQPRPQVTSRFGTDNHPDSIDFPGFNPYRRGPEATRFPAPVTPRAPAKSPKQCVWAIVVCCRNLHNIERQSRCFEATDCLSWDSDRCSENNISAANWEIRNFYLKSRAGFL